MRLVSFRVSLALRALVAVRLPHPIVASFILVCLALPASFGKTKIRRHLRLGRRANIFLWILYWKSHNMMVLTADFYKKKRLNTSRWIDWHEYGYAETQSGGGLDIRCPLVQRMCGHTEGFQLICLLLNRDDRTEAFATCNRCYLRRHDVSSRKLAQKPALLLMLLLSLYLRRKLHNKRWTCGCNVELDELPQKVWQGRPDTCDAELENSRSDRIYHVHLEIAST